MSCYLPSPPPGGSPYLQPPPGDYPYQLPPGGYPYQQAQPPSGGYSYQQTLPPSAASRAGHILIAPVRARMNDTTGIAATRLPPMPDFSRDVVDLKSFFEAFSDAADALMLDDMGRVSRLLHQLPDTVRFYLDAEPDEVPDRFSYPRVRNAQDVVPARLHEDDGKRRVARDDEDYSILDFCKWCGGTPWSPPPQWHEAPPSEFPAGDTVPMSERQPPEWVRLTTEDRVAAQKLQLNERFRTLRDVLVRKYHRGAPLDELRIVVHSCLGDDKFVQASIKSNVQVTSGRLGKLLRFFKEQTGGTPFGVFPGLANTLLRQYNAAIRDLVSLDSPSACASAIDFFDRVAAAQRTWRRQHGQSEPFRLPPGVVPLTINAIQFNDRFDVGTYCRRRMAARRGEDLPDAPVVAAMPQHRAAPSTSAVRAPHQHRQPPPQQQPSAQRQRPPQPPQPPPPAAPSPSASEVALQAKIAALEALEASQAAQIKKLHADADRGSKAIDDLRQQMTALTKKGSGGGGADAGGGGTGRGGPHPRRGDSGAPTLAPGFRDLPEPQKAVLREQERLIRFSTKWPASALADMIPCPRTDPDHSTASVPRLAGPGGPNTCFRCLWSGHQWGVCPWSWVHGFPKARNRIATTGPPRGEHVPKPIANAPMHIPACYKAASQQPSQQHQQQPQPQQPSLPPQPPQPPQSTVNAVGPWGRPPWAQQWGPSPWSTPSPWASQLLPPNAPGGPSSPSAPPLPASGTAPQQWQQQQQWQQPQPQPQQQQHQQQRQHQQQQPQQQHQQQHQQQQQQQQQPRRRRRRR